MLFKSFITNSLIYYASLVIGINGLSIPDTNGKVCYRGGDKSSVCTVDCPPCWKQESKDVFHCFEYGDNNKCLFDWVDINAKSGGSKSSESSSSESSTTTQKKTSKEVETSTDDSNTSTSNGGNTTTDSKNNKNSKTSSDDKSSDKESKDSSDSESTITSTRVTTTQIGGKKISSTSTVVLVVTSKKMNTALNNVDSSAVSICSSILFSLSMVGISLLH
ncbi:hypothetical protein K502DRAFT_366132 [Neoconidiobolus thromboides FSU 785]|nr:hypothetical protein K502DRAFT_366132 [Neoconidiobolus thromboides FSU 785]